MRNRVIGIYYQHENHALFCASNDYCITLRTKGFVADFVDVGTPEGLKKLAVELDSGEMAFCFGLQGVGSNLTHHDVNLWTAAKVPFIGIHYDNPCYNFHNHFNASPYVANLYHCESFLEIQRRYLGGNQLNIAVPMEMFVSPPQAKLAFRDRPIKLLYLKTGEKLDELVEYFNSLPPALKQGVWGALDNMWRDPNLLICDVVADLFQRHGYDRIAYNTQFWAVVQSMDFYLRRKRAIAFVDWLKFQEGAVIIGKGWDFIDKTGARAEFRPPMPIWDAMYLYGQAQFTCNTNPYGRDMIHERVTNGLMSDCCVISDTNAWWDEHFKDAPSLIRFDWSQPLDQQLAPVVNDIDRAAAVSTAGSASVLKHFTGHNYIERIISFAEEVRQKAS
jgi:hypothetical protein